MAKTKIEWTEMTWNPVTGCTPVSEGCRNCYARRMARRLAGRYGYPKAPRHFDVTLHPDRLDTPLRRRKPTTYFVCSMGDLFHENVPDEFIHDVWAAMMKTPQHTYQVLTKRPGRMSRFVGLHHGQFDAGYSPPPFNVWLGVSVENQATADERIPLLLQTPAAVRFVSCEPLLSEIDLSSYLHCGISWCIIGAESGQEARPMDENWVRRIISQCNQHEVPVFYKQRMENGKKISLPILDGKRHAEFPRIIDKQSES